MHLHHLQGLSGINVAHIYQCSTFLWLRICDFATTEIILNTQIALTTDDNRYYTFFHYVARVSCMCVFCNLSTNDSARKHTCVPIDRILIDRYLGSVNGDDKLRANLFRWRMKDVPVRSRYRSIQFFYGFHQVNNVVGIFIEFELFVVFVSRRSLSSLWNDSHKCACDRWRIGF